MACLGNKASEFFAQEVFHALKMILLKVYIMLGDSCLNKLDAATKGTKWVSNSSEITYSHTYSGAL